MSRYDAETDIGSDDSGSYIFPDPAEPSAVFDSRNEQEGHENPWVEVEGTEEDDALDTLTHIDVDLLSEFGSSSFSESSPIDPQTILPSLSALSLSSAFVSQNGSSGQLPSDPVDPSSSAINSFADDDANPTLDSEQQQRQRLLHSESDPMLVNHWTAIPPPSDSLDWSNEERVLLLSLHQDLVLITERTAVATSEQAKDRLARAIEALSEGNAWGSEGGGSSKAEGKRPDRGGGPSDTLLPSWLDVRRYIHDVRESLRVSTEEVLRSIQDDSRTQTRTGIAEMEQRAMHRFNLSGLDDTFKDMFVDGMFNDSLSASTSSSSSSLHSLDTMSTSSGAGPSSSRPPNLPSVPSSSSSPSSSSNLSIILRALAHISQDFLSLLSSSDSNKSRSNLTMLILTNLGLLSVILRKVDESLPILAQAASSTASSPLARLALPLSPLTAAAIIAAVAVVVHVVTKLPGAIRSVVGMDLRREMLEEYERMYYGGSILGGFAGARGASFCSAPVGMAAPAEETSEWREHATASDDHEMTRVPTLPAVESPWAAEHSRAQTQATTSQSASASASESASASSSAPAAVSSSSDSCSPPPGQASQVHSLLSSAFSTALALPTQLQTQVSNYITGTPGPAYRRALAGVEGVMLRDAGAAVAGETRGVLRRVGNALQGRLGFVFREGLEEEENEGKGKGKGKGEGEEEGNGDGGGQGGSVEGNTTGDGDGKQRREETGGGAVDAEHARAQESGGSSSSAAGSAGDGDGGKGKGKAKQL